MILRVVKGDNPGQDITVDGGVFAIGREKDNSFVINDPGVSRHHCIFRREGSQWWVEDLQSVNGVTVNAVKITEKTQLKPGDEITVFNHIFVFEPMDVVPVAANGLKVRKLEQLPGDTSAIAPPGAVPASTPTPAPAPAPAPTSAPASSKAEPAASNGPSPIILIVKIAMLLIILALAGYMAMLMFSGDPQAGTEPMELAAAGDSAAAPGAGATATAPGAEQTTALLDPATLDQLEAPVDEAPMFAPLTDAAPQAEPTRLRPLPQANAGGGGDGDDDDGGAAAPLVAGAAVNLVLITSDPSAAEVYLDDQPVGTTPLLLRDASPGRHMLALRKDGYEDLTRQIQVPDQLPSRPYQLRLKAGTLLITSEPSGAWVMQGRRFLGQTPLLLSDLPAGEHEFILRGPGCEPQKVAASVNPAAGETVRAELASLLGNIELNSRPPGCRVYLDGVLMGETAEMEGNPMRAAPYILKSLTAGPALLKVEHPSGINVTGKITIPKGGTVRQQAALWVPTHRLTLIDGAVKFGLLLEENELGDVALEEVGRRSARYLKPQIAELHRLSNAEITEYIAQSNKSRQDAAAGAGGEAMELARKDDLVMSVADMLQDLRRLTINDFNAAYRDKQIRISGKSSTRYKDNTETIFVEFGTKAIRCTFEKNTPNEDWEIISQAAKAKTPISVRGFCEGLKNDIVVMSNCSLVMGFQ